MAVFLYAGRFDGYDYFVEGDEVLENKLNIIDPTKLKEIEEALVAREGMCIIEEDLRPDAYDFAFLKYLHRRLFGKIYSFAGQVRTVNIAKMDSNIPFCYADFIEQEAERIFVELRRRNFLVGLLRDEFADNLAELAMDLNALHPFREGNGRTIRLYLQLLSRNAGYSLDYAKASREQIIEGDKQAFLGNDATIKEMYREIVKPIRENPVA